MWVYRYMHTCVCVHMFVLKIIFFLSKDPTTRSIKVTYSFSFYFTFANQNIKAQSQHIPKYQEVKKKIMLNVLFLISTSLH